MTRSPASLQFLFDFLSPYAYLVWTQVHAIAARNGLEVEPVPVLFAGLLDAHGQKGPAEIPAKRRYTFKDAARKAHALGLPPLRPPPTHPFNPLLALRVASLPLEREPRRQLIDRLFAATWVDGTGVESPASVAAAASSIGLDGAALIRAAGEPDTKARLRARTDEAIASGVFGVPTVLVRGELFWGTDGLQFVEPFLRGDEPPHMERAWLDLQASATRKAAQDPR